MSHHRLHSLGRRVHKDLRDRGHLMLTHLGQGPKELPTKKLWSINGTHLDQGPTGTCVGHGWRNFLRCAPIQTSAPDPNAFKIYKAAILLDPWKNNDAEAKLPDGDPGLESGTTVRAGAKALQAMNYLSSYAWAFSLQPAVEWVLTRGPVVMGTNWYSNMFESDKKGLVKVGGSIAGGHCYLWRGVDVTTGLGRFTNSWGDGFAKHGDFYMDLHDVERLIMQDGEVCTAVQSR